MELDDFKQTWNSTSIHSPQNQNIMDIIQHKSHGPVNALKKAFQRQIIFFGIMPFVLILTNLDDVHNAVTSLMFQSYTAFCIIAILFSLYNYRVLRKMEWMDGMVRPNLEQYIRILETSLHWIIIGLRVGLVYFIILAEIVPHFHHYRILEYWHAVHPAVRIITYVVLLILQYFISRKNNQRKFGDHVLYLKNLVKEMN